MAAKPGYKIFTQSTLENHKRTHFNPMGTISITSLRTPIVRIEDHKSQILSCDFHPSGKYALSANRNGQIYVCNIYGKSSKTMVMKGHQGAVMEAHFSRDGFNVYSCSADSSLGIWDTFKGVRKVKFEEHTASVNSVQGARTAYSVLCSGSNDNTVRIWGAREEDCAMTLRRDTDVTATCFSEDGEYVISGGLDGDIKICDLRTRETVCNLRGHIGKITAVSLSPCGSYLLSNSSDNTIRVWDIRPHVTFKRCVGCFHYGEELLRCAWSPDGTMISAGTSDHDVFIWDAVTGETLCQLPGHEASITDIGFHPNEPIVLSASSDHYLFLHELKKNN